MLGFHVKNPNRVIDGGSFFLQKCFYFAVFSFKFEFYPIWDVKFSFLDPGIRKAPDPVSVHSTLQSHDTWHFLEQLIDFASCCSARCPRCACQDRWRRRPYSSRVSLSTLSTPFSPPSMWVPLFTVSLEELCSHSKKLKKWPRPVLYLGLKLTIHITKTQIHLRETVPLMYS